MAFVSAVGPTFVAQSLDDNALQCMKMTMTIRYAVKKNDGIIWEFFPNNLVSTMAVQVIMVITLMMTIIKDKDDNDDV